MLTAIWPLAYVCAKRACAPGAVERARQLLGADILDGMLTVVEEGVREEVSGALNAGSVEREFYKLAARFGTRLLPPTLDANMKIFKMAFKRDSRSLDLGLINETAEIEKELLRELTGLLRGTGYAQAENLARGLSVLADYDLWYLRRVSELSMLSSPEDLEGMARDALGDIMVMHLYLFYSLFACVSAVSAVAGIVERFKEENRDALAARCMELAEELDAYIDTVDTHLDKEAREVLKRLGLTPS
jgi:hypothetical protein